MSPCPSTARTALTRTGAMAVVFGTAFGLVLGPAGLALAQDAAPSTVRAVVGADGAVESVDRIGSDEAPGDLPVTLKIAEDGDTTSYTVENTTVEQQTVSYLDAEGKPATAKQDVALPLVAQLAVRLPASRTAVEALGARVTKLADGSTELVWSMVLFGPIGSPVNEVSWTAAGTGDGVARLDVAAVQPNATPGLSAVGQAANATVNGNGILNTVATGANEGLLKLSDGVGQLLTGLDKLYDGAQKLNVGIVAAVDGAEQLADGSEKAYTGSQELAVGLGKLSAGNGALAEGASQLDAGAGKISDGLGSAQAGGTKLAEGSTALSTGATQAAAGAKALSDGLAQISGGLDQISAAQGLPAALDGAQKLRAGVEQLRAGLGAPATEGTILNGVAKLAGGLAQVKGGLDQLSGGLPGAIGGVDQIKSAIDTTMLPGLGSPTVAGNTIRYAIESVRAGLASSAAGGGSIDQALGALALAGVEVDKVQASLTCTPAPAPGDCTSLATIEGYLAAVTSGLNTSKASSSAGAAALESAGTGLTGIAGGLSQFSGGLGQISGGLNAAAGGVAALQAGVTQLQTGTTALNGGLLQIAGGLKSGDPTKPGIAEGLDALVTGLTTAVGGVTQLAAGAKTAATGSTALSAGNTALAAGATQIAKGNGDLSAGLTQLYTGSKELKAGTAKIDDGAGQLATGAGAAAKGAGDLRDGLGKIADGQRKVADGLPAAADGSGQLADGLGQVVDGEQKVATGLSDLRSKAISVLSSQFTQGTELARQQLAGLDAASAMIASTPGAATTTWVLTQSDGDISAELASDDSDLGRNAAIGAGGVLLLLGGIAGGYLSGRRKSVV